MGQWNGRRCKGGAWGWGCLRHPLACPLLALTVADCVFIKEFFFLFFFFKKKLQFRKVSTCKNFLFLCHPFGSFHSFEPSSWVFLLILSHFLQKHVDFFVQNLLQDTACLHPFISGYLCGLSPMAEGRLSLLCWLFHYSEWLPLDISFQ